MLFVPGHVLLAVSAAWGYEGAGHVGVVFVRPLRDRLYLEYVKALLVALPHDLMLVLKRGVVSLGFCQRTEVVGVDLVG